jgi:acetyl-CoA carboxylase biotin carboxyl carrier protein
MHPPFLGFAPIGEGGQDLLEIEAEIAGSVWKVEAAVGDRVEEEQVLLILESMKMEIPVEAPCAGVVRAIKVEEGATVEEGTVLVLIESE